MKPAPAGHLLPPDSESRRLRRGLLLCIVIANALLLCLCATEQLQYKKGLAWDSGIYYRMIQHGLPKLFQQTVSAYYIQRILPGLLVDIAFKVLHIPAIGVNVLRGFTCLNLLCINVAAIYIFKTLRLLRANEQTVLVGVGLFFCNVFVLKCALFMPVGTDTLSLLLGVLLLYAHFSRQPLLLLGLCLAGAFTHPLLLFAGSLLYAFPFRGLAEQKDVPRKLRQYEYAIAGVPVAAMLTLYLVFQAAITAQVSSFPHPTTPVVLGLYPLSLALMLCCIAVIAIMFLKVDFISTVMKAASWTRVAVALLLVVACRLWQNSMANPEPVALDARQYLLNLAQQAVTFPLGFIAAHVNFFGLSIIILLLHLNKAFSWANRLGAGFLLLLLLSAILFLGMESRQMLFLFPVLLLPAAFILGERQFPPWAWTVIILTGIVVARPWYLINLAPFTGVPQAYPDQRLFINYGPWMTLRSYLLLLAIASGALVVLLLITRSVSRRRAGPQIS